MKFNIDKDGLISLLSSLIRQPTVNPPGNEYLVREIVDNAFRELGARIKIIGEEQRPNILGEIGEGRPVVAILSHMDVVPPGEGWEIEPFEPVIKNGRIYGRGAEDNKGPFAASWAAVKAFLGENRSFQGKIILGAVADEERGSEKGMKLLLENGFKADVCLIPDGGKWNKAVIGEKGMLWVKINIFGKTAHGSEPEKGINAIRVLIKVIEKIEEQARFGSFHPLFSAPTMNLGEIRGGEAPNMVPSQAECVLDFRYPAGVEKEEIIKKIKSILETEKDATPGISFRLEILQETYPHLIEESNPWISKFKKSASDTGINLQFTTIGGNTVAKLLYERGIVAFSHSPEDISSAHQANESVSIEKLLLCANLWANFLKRVFEDDR
ncbi:MAG: M20 family metallopeptidase [Caldiserica bacterium]|nr:M20 family metallopeptidase [Caldisericota bacterium]